MSHLKESCVTLIAARFVVDIEATNNIAKDVRLHFAVEGTVTSLWHAWIWRFGAAGQNVC
jgi:hypothetical protein